MDQQDFGDYYLSRTSAISADFKKEARRWKVILAQRYGDDFAETVLQEAGQRLTALIPAIPYIGGDENHLTDSLISAVRYLAFYEAMTVHGKSAQEAGKLLYDAIIAFPEDYIPQISPSEKLSRDVLMCRRRERADRSQERRYAWDYVYCFLEGDGESFDYGYDFIECGAQKFYRAQGSEAFLPFYCFLDFPKCELVGLGLARTMTLAEGHPHCNFRFKQDGKADQSWPPRFIKPKGSPAR